MNIKYRFIIILFVCMFCATLALWFKSPDSPYNKKFVAKVYSHSLECWANIKRGEIISVNDGWVELHHMKDSFNRRIGTTWSFIDGRHRREDFKYYKTN